MNDVRTLCSQCKQIYETAGFEPTINGWQDIKEPCDICGKPGYEYVIHDVKSSEVKQNGQNRKTECNRKR